MKILDQRQIKQKTKRLAIEILENNYSANEFILAGINNNGMGFAHMLMEELLEITDSLVTVTRIRLNPAAPTTSEVHIEMPPEKIEGKVLIVVDDVANTGRTLFYAMKPLLDVLPSKIEIAVLVDRKHKAFPINTDYVGLTLATTMKEHIRVNILKAKEQAVFLD